MADELAPDSYQSLVRQALAEDVGPGDLTTSAIVPADARGTAVLIARAPCVLAGLAVAHEVFVQLDSTVTFEPVRRDGDAVGRDEVITRLSGRSASMLTAERTALNFLQHLSGIATLTRRFVDAAAGRIVILDTRKTLPTFRPLAKYAVRCGGGTNHRSGLYDGVLIKDNHIRSAGGIVEAVRRVRATVPGRPLEVETQSLDDVEAAVSAGAETIMLDNLSMADMREAVRRIAGRSRVEISGGVTLDRVSELAGLGADSVSVGALTHSAPAADISLEFTEV